MPRPPKHRVSTDDDDLRRRLGLEPKRAQETPAEWNVREELRQYRNKKNVKRIYRELPHRPPKGPRPQKVLPRPKRMGPSDYEDIRRHPHKVVDQSPKLWKDDFDNPRYRFKLFRMMQELYELGPVDRLLDIFELLDMFTTYWFYDPDADPVPNPGSGWRLRSECPPQWSQPGPRVFSDSHFPTASTNAVNAWIADGAPVSSSCLTGQAIRQNPDGLNALDLGMSQWRLQNGWPVGHQFARYSVERTWWRPASAPWVLPVLLQPVRSSLGPSLSSMPDPNIVRRMPAPRTRPHISPSPVEELSLNPEPDPNLVPPPPARPSQIRKPPAPYERERKVMTRSKRFMVMLFKVLDDLSELSEIVDSFYDALPDKTKKRWKCNRQDLVDQAGQYGIDNADCKMKALFHNWHAVDPVAAVENIVKNQLEDALIGGIKSKLPPQASAVGGEKELSQLLDAIWPDWRNWE